MTDEERKELARMVREAWGIVAVLLARQGGRATITRGELEAIEPSRDLEIIIDVKTGDEFVVQLATASGDAPKPTIALDEAHVDRARWLVQTEWRLGEIADARTVLEALVAAAGAAPATGPLGDDGVDADRAAGPDRQADVDAHGRERGRAAAEAAQGHWRAEWKRAACPCCVRTVVYRGDVPISDTSWDPVTGLPCEHVPAVVADVGVRSAGAAGHEARVARVEGEDEPDGRD